MKSEKITFEMLPEYMAALCQKVDGLQETVSALPTTPTATAQTDLMTRKQVKEALQ